MWLVTQWLTDEQLASWLPTTGVMLRLGPALDSQLQRDSAMTHFDYLCLAMLSEVDSHTMAMSALASRTNASLSRLSHVISKLERRGWVSRCPSQVSRRVTDVRMTEDGHRALVELSLIHI